MSRPGAIEYTNLNVPFCEWVGPTIGTCAIVRSPPRREPQEHRLAESRPQRRSRARVRAACRVVDSSDITRPVPRLRPRGRERAHPPGSPRTFGGLCLTATVPSRRRCTHQIEVLPHARRRPQRAARRRRGRSRRTATAHPAPVRQPAADGRGVARPICAGTSRRHDRAAAPPCAWRGTGGSRAGAARPPRWPPSRRGSRRSAGRPGAGSGGWCP